MTKKSALENLGGDGTVHVLVTGLYMFVKTYRTAH